MILLKCQVIMMFVLNVLDFDLNRVLTEVRIDPINRTVKRVYRLVVYKMIDAIYDPIEMKCNYLHRGDPNVIRYHVYPLK